MILGTICCRGGSKGMERKNIRLLHGRPLISYTIATALDCKHLDDVIVSTDDEEIAEVAMHYGGKVLFRRPANLATDSISKWPVFMHAAEAYETRLGKTIDYLVDMDVTVPLKSAADISGAIKLAQANSETDVVITAYKPERNPYFNMMETDRNGFAQLVKQTAEPIVRRQDAPPVFSLTPAAYVIKKSALYNYAHWSQAKCKLYEMPRERAIDVDTEMDFTLVEYLLSTQASNV